MNSSSFLILNGEIVEEHEASVSPVNRGMMYGDGCFETIRSYCGKFFGWEAHIHRLFAGLNYLEMDAVFTSDELKGKVLKLLSQNKLDEKQAMLRIQCWREGERGYSTSSRKMNWMVQASEIQPKKDPLKLAVAKTRCIPAEALERRFKLSNGLNYIKAAQEANIVQCDDSLMLTVAGKISETTSSNIFWVHGNTVYTPSVSCDLLPGITRDYILQAVKKRGIKLREGEYELDELLNAEAVFCTNSLIEICEVRSIDGTEFELNHPLVKQIRKEFEALKNEGLQG